MPILLGLVAYEHTPIASFNLSEPKAKDISVELLKKATYDGKKISIEQGSIVFSLISETSRSAFVCVSSKDVSLEARFFFLSQMKSQFYGKYSDFSSFSANSKDSEFGPQIKSLLEQVNNPTNEKLAQIRNNLVQASEVMTQNLQAALGRSEQLESLEKKADGLKSNAQLFQTEAVSIKRHACWEHYKWWVIGSIILLIIILLLIII